MILRLKIELKSRFKHMVENYYIIIVFLGFKNSKLCFNREKLKMKKNFENMLR